MALVAPSAPTDLREALASFLIEEELGRGGMGTAYRALDAETGETRCLKVLRPGLAYDEDFVGRLAQEAISMAQLDHPGIVRFHRIGREGHFYYLVLEYVEGQDLGRLIDASSRLEVGRVVRFGVEVCRALEYAHARNVIHRDIKPSNLLVDARDHVRLTDFGLARILDVRKKRITDTGTILGSVRFSAPELFEDAKRAGPLADQYSLASTIYFALTGQFPVPGRALRDFVQGVDTRPRIPLLDRRPDVPCALSEGLERALAKDPAERFPAIAEFRGAIEAFAEGGPEGAPTATVVP